jgi:SAM-dependent methyltransferase
MVKVDICDMAANVELGADGIWWSRARTAVSYPEGGNELYAAIEQDSFWFNHRNRCLVEVLKRFPPDGREFRGGAQSTPFFDIGGGNGYVSLAIQNAGWPAVLIEPGPSGARIARRRGVRDVICSTFQDAGFAERSMAAAGAFDVVEHIEDDLGFLRSVARTMQAGGRLYLTVPAFRSLWSAEDDDAGHFRRYTLASLSSVAERAGFQVEYLTYFFTFLPVPIFLLRTIPHKLGLRRPAEPQDASRTQAEHRAPGGLSNLLLDRLLNREIARIRTGRTMRTGSSCLAVLRARGE